MFFATSKGDIQMLIHYGSNSELSLQEPFREILQELRPVSFVLRKSAENQLEKTEAAESKRYGFIAQVNYTRNE